MDFSEQVHRASAATCRLAESQRAALPEQQALAAQAIARAEQAKATRDKEPKPATIAEESRQNAGEWLRT